MGIPASAGATSRLHFKELPAVKEPFDLAEELELELLEQRVRADASRLDQLIADDFREVTGTGRTFGKDEVLARLPHESDVEFSTSHMRSRLLAPTVCLVTYRAQRTHEGVTVKSERSSIWIKCDGWRMVHHQGTVTD